MFFVRVLKMLQCHSNVLVKQLRNNLLRHLLKHTSFINTVFETCLIIFFQCIPSLSCQLFQKRFTVFAPKLCNYLHRCEEVKPSHRVVLFFNLRHSQSSSSLDKLFNNFFWRSRKIKLFLLVFFLLFVDLAHKCKNLILFG